jgi:hypothetical protein
MRTLPLWIGLTLTAPLFGEERTWTIATGVFTTKAELVAVRGDLAYLKIGDKIEEYPLARLSATDQHYIASLALAPVVPGPAEEAPTPPLPNTSPNIVPPTLTPASPSATRAGDVSLLKSGPALAPPITEEAIPLPPDVARSNQTSGGLIPNNQGRTTRSSNYGSITPPSAMSNQTSYRSTSAQSLNNYNSNARRYVPQQQLSQSQQSQLRRTTAQQNQNQSDPGILGIRARRNDRLRGR